MPRVNIAELIKDGAHPACGELMNACAMIASVNEARSVARAAGVISSDGVAAGSMNVASAVERVQSNSRA